jgi:quinol monooxygenase YgiN
MVAQGLLIAARVLAMEPVHVISGLRLVAKPEQRSDLLDHLDQWVAGVSRTPGCIKVTTSEQIADPNIIYAVVEWENLEALEDFRVSQVAKDLARPLVANLAEKAQTTRFRADEVAEEDLISF